MASRRVDEVQYQIVRAAVDVLLRALKEIAEGAEHPQEVALQALDNASAVVGEV